MPNPSRSWRSCGEIALIVAAVLMVYSQVLGHGFVALDDGLYVSSCAQVRKGLTWEGFLWAWTNFDAANYHPLTWLSYMADVAVFGIEPGWIAFENALLHALNGWLVLRLLQELGCSRGGALLGALVFVVHPVNVESVAWISQRKTVLAAAFGLAALLLYLHRAQRGVSPVGGWVLVCFAASLLAKPWFVVLPVLLLVLDEVVLRRLERGAAVEGGRQRRLVERLRPVLVEKIPLGVVLAGAVVLALLAQKSVGAIATLQKVPFLFRIENALVSLIAYVADFLSPGGLSVFYPSPAAYSVAQLWAPALLALALASAVLVTWRRQPAVAGGVLWFLLFLLPVIGLVQVGEQARADRYLYLPLIGLIWIGVWGLERARGHLRPWLRNAVLVLAVGWLGFTAFITYRQVSYWKNTYLLVMHSLKVVGPTRPLVSMLGSTYLELGDPQLALPLFEALARQKNPVLRDVISYAQSLHAVGRHREAIEVCRQVVAYDARNYYAHAYLAVWLLEAGEPVQAAEHADKMRAIGPPYGHVPFDPKTVPVP